MVLLYLSVLIGALCYFQLEITLERVPGSECSIWIASQHQDRPTPEAWMMRLP